MAQETFAEFLRDDIAPILREMGFRGSGRRYTLPHSDRYAVVAFQTQRTKLADRVKFTVNVSVVGKRQWEAARASDPSLPEIPSAVLRYGPESGVWHRRLGSLVDGHERWWTLHESGTKRALVAHDVLATISGVIVPALVERLAD
ncbi:MAG TPA: DUF4304 domain-containing protein [Dermatophilaceae bacterium]|nr:DUF4304 domain-containing protein [Dermatophilaceae bacterium]